MQPEIRAGCEIVQTPLYDVTVLGMSLVFLLAVEHLHLCRCISVSRDLVLCRHALDSCKITVGEFDLQSRQGLRKLLLRPHAKNRHNIFPT